MRTIKFRAWHKGVKEMAKVDTLHSNGYVHLSPITKISSDSKMFKLVDVELMQFTGLLDKNGKEIYEGDILKVRARDKGFNIHKRNETFWTDFYEFLGEVYTEPMMWLFRPVEKTGWQGHLVTINAHVKESGGEIEIIGNIYENPELLSNQSVL